MSEYNNRRDDEVFENVKEAMTALLNVMNVMGNDTPVKDAVKVCLKGEHRTLQQAFFRNIIATSIEAFAEMDENGYTDLRNKSACECATKMTSILNDTYMPFI